MMQDSYSFHSAHFKRTHDGNVISLYREETRLLSEAEVRGGKKVFDALATNFCTSMGYRGKRESLQNDLSQRLL